MLESQIENAFVNHVESLGGEALKLVILGQRGFPDRTLFLPKGRMAIAEVKKPGGQLSPQQTWWLQRLRELGHYAFDFDNLEDGKRLLNAYLEGRREDKPY